MGFLDLWGGTSSLHFFCSNACLLTWKEGVVLCCVGVSFARRVQVDCPAWCAVGRWALLLGNSTYNVEQGGHR